MYRSPSGRRAHQPLSIRTVNHNVTQVSSQQYTQHGKILSSPQLLQPSWPLPIPEDKQAKARKLYNKYKLELALDHSKREPQSANVYLNSLHVPGPSAPRSVTSNTSSRHNRATSISNSTYDAYTELSSVLSFDDEESISSTNIKAERELMSFDGRPVKPTRTRSKLSSVKRAHAALKRHLGSCQLCHSRKVTVSNDSLKGRCFS
jgi:hypothetical protein